ncbi:MAG: aminoacyl-tRNA hydrolase [Bdellovibrionota bacterium]
MHLIVGLGNPGSKYEFTRHNIGFLVIDKYLSKISTTEKSEQKSLTYKTEVGGLPVLLVKPQTFMNLSGEAVRGLMAFYKIPLENLLVLHDDIDQNYMSIKFQQNSSSGGQNGINSIHQLLGTQNYTRMKLGVGRPILPKQSVVDWVLQKFAPTEAEILDSWLDECCNAINTFVTQGYEKAASLHNIKTPPFVELLEKGADVSHFQKLKEFLKPVRKKPDPAKMEAAMKEKKKE